MLERFPMSTVVAPELGAIAERMAAIPDEAPTTAAIEAAPRPRLPHSMLSDKLLDAKVRLHQRLLEEVNLSVLEKLSDEETRRHVSELVGQYILADNLALNTQEFENFVTEVLHEMTGLGAIEPLLKDPTIGDIMINGHN